MEKDLIRRLFETRDAANLQLSKAELSQLSNLMAPSIEAAITQVASSYSSILISVDLSKNLFKEIISQLDIVSSIYFSQISLVQNIAKLIAENHVAALSQIRTSVLLTSAFLEQIRGIADLQQTFAAQFAESLFNAIKVSADEKDDNHQFRAVVEQAIKEQPNAKSKLEVLNFIFAIIGIIFTGVALFFSNEQSRYSKLQYELSQQDSADNDRKFSQYMKVLQEIAAKIEGSNESNEVFYIVERQVDVKIRPHFKSPRIVILYPNQKVRLVRTDHKWIYIEYFDYIDGAFKLGWVSKKYLVKMK